MTNRLTDNDIAFERVIRAQKEGDKPSVSFSIENSAAVEAFFNDAENQVMLSEKRIEYTITGRTLTISRQVVQTTLPFPANVTLAETILKNIYEAPLAYAADIYIGLTRQLIPENLYDYFAQIHENPFGSQFDL